MRYETPVLEGPAELYESPVLLEVGDAVAGVCITGGSCDGEVEQDSGGGGGW